MALNSFRMVERKRSSVFNTEFSSLFRRRRILVLCVLTVLMAGVSIASSTLSANNHQSQHGGSGSKAPAVVSVAASQIPNTAASDPSGIGQLSLFVGYADNLRPSGFFPDPWQGSANSVFIGGGTSFDAGAIRIDNKGATNVTLDSVSVDLSRPGPVFNLWGNNIIVPAGSSLILTQTGSYNFDTSDYPFEPCGTAASAGQEPFPKVFVSVGGISHQFNDTAHVIDTLGYDLACIGNESEPWRAIGCSVFCVAKPELSLTASASPLSTGHLETITASVIDNSTDTVVTGALVNFTVTGANSASGSCSTDSTGKCAFTYTGSNAGVDTISGKTTVRSFLVLSSPVSVTWTGGSFDFSVVAIPSEQTVLAGGTTTYQIMVAVTSGTPQPVSLAFNPAQLPLGATGSFSVPNPLPTTNVMLQIATSSTGGLGDFNLTVTGISGSVTHTTSVVIHVYDFAITSSLCQQTVLRGSIAPFNLTFTLVAGSSTIGLPPITIQTSGLPSDATFSPSVVTLSSTPVVVQFQIKTGSVSLGDFPFSISGVDIRTPEGGSRQVSNCSGGFATHVFQPVIGYSCSTDATAGGSIFCTINVGLVSGSSQFDIKPGTISFTGLPPGSIVFCSPQSGVPPFNAGCTIILPSGSLGLFSFGVSGVFGGGAIGAGGGTVLGAPPGGGSGGTLTLHIYDFTVHVNNEETVLRGGTALYNVTVALVPGSSTVNLPTISLSVSGLPPGTNMTLIPTSGNAAGFTALLRIQTSAATPLGDFSFIVNGTDVRPLLGGFRIGSGLLHVYDFTIVSSPSSSFGNVGGTSSYNETLTLVAGSSTKGIPQIQLKVNGLPAGSSATFSPVSVIPSLVGASTTMTVQPSVAGTFNLAIIGTDTRVSEGGSRSSLPQSPQTLVALAEGSLTDTSYCPFDVDSSLAGQQFHLIFTPSTGAYELSASNPGQFYDNVFFAGIPGSVVTLKIMVPYPFVTQGAVPIQVYSGVGFSGPCFIPLNNITPGFSFLAGGTLSPSGAPVILLGDYGPQAFGSSVTITVTGKIPASGLVYVTVHLNYGLRQTSGYSKNLNGDAVNATSGATLIPNLESYNFSQTGNSTTGIHLSSTTTVQSENVFKKDPGIGGLVLDQNGTPVLGAKVQIYDSSGHLLATVYTDQDGWYMWSYKYTGKATTFTISLSSFGVQQSVTLKSNGSIVANFTVKI